MARAKQITVRGWVRRGDELIPWEEQTPEELAQRKKEWSERLSENMSDYFNQHPEELAKICQDKEKDSA